MPVPVGLDLICYYNSGTYGSPTWVGLSTVKDLTMDGDTNESPATARLSSWEMTVQGLKKAGVQFNILRDKSVGDWDTLKAAWITRNIVLDIALADGAIATSGTEYFRAQYNVKQFKVNEPLETASTADVALSLAYASTQPAFVTVSGS